MRQRRVFLFLLVWRTPLNALLFSATLSVSDCTAWGLARARPRFYSSPKPQFAILFCNPYTLFLDSNLTKGGTV